MDVRMDVGAGVQQQFQVAGGRQMQKKVKVPLFVSKVYEMIESRDNSEIVEWTSTRDSFAIKSITRFTEEILPEYFKHNNFSSFIRQLNMYGFNKIRHSEGENVYMHQYFKAGAKGLLRRISRKNKEEKGKEAQVELYQPPRGSRAQVPVTKRIQELRVNQKNLEEMSRYFMNQNQRLLEENQNFVRRLDKQQKEKEEKLEEILIYLLTQKTTHTLLNSPSQTQLAIANQQFEGQPQHAIKQEQPNDMSPLELIDKAISRNEEFSAVKNMIQGIYSKKQRKKQPNFAVQSHEIINKKNGDFNDYIEPEYLNLIESNQVGHEMKEVEKDGNLSSIYDFFNADEEPHLPFSSQDQ